MWHLTTTEPSYSHSVLPDGCIDIIYDRQNGLSIAGTMTREHRFDYTGCASMTGIRFHPGKARAMFQFSPSELSDRNAPIEDRWARELKQHLDDAPSVEDASRILAGYFDAPRNGATPIQSAIDYLVTTGGNADLDFTASQANLSVRHFRRLCIDETGISPKRLCRILRFRRASRLSEGTNSWSGIAAEAGYFDQAHLIRDFREFTGRSPMAVLSNTAALRPR